MLTKSEFLSGLNKYTKAIAVSLNPEYTLPTASANQKGGVKIGKGLFITGDSLNVTLDDVINYFDGEIADTNARIDHVDINIAELDARIDSIVLDSAASRLSAVEGEVDVIKADVELANLNFLSTSEDIANVNEKVSALNEKINSIDVHDYSGDISAVDTKINSVDEKVSALETKVDAINVTDYSSDISALNEKVSDVTAKVDSIVIPDYSSDISVINTKISATDDRFLTVDGQISAVDDRVTALDEKVAAINTTDFTNDISVLSNRIAELGDKVDAIDTNEISTTAKKVSDLADSLGAVAVYADDVPEINSRLEIVEGAATKLEGDLSDLVVHVATMKTGEEYTAGYGLSLADGEFSVSLNVADEIGTFKGGTYTETVGIAGLVPPPAYPYSSSLIHYLRSDGQWAKPTDTTYSVATTSTNGLMSSTDKAKLDKLASITAAGNGITISGGTISAGCVAGTVASTTNGAMWIEV